MKTKNYTLPPITKRIERLVLSNRLHALSEANRGSTPPMATFAHDHIGHHINVFGIYEHQELALLFKFLEPVLAEFSNGRALDIGGNIGNHARYFSPYFNAVDTFEPNGRVFALLNLNTSEYANVTAHNYGLSDTTTSALLCESIGNLGASSLGDQGISVDVRRLDELGYDDVAFMKLDIERHEAAALAGAAGTITRCQPFIVFEQHISEFRNGSTAAIDLLCDQGYSFAWMKSPEMGGKLMKLWSLVRERVTGRRFTIVVNDTVPPGTYLMLMAIPGRFREALISDKT